MIAPKRVKPKVKNNLVGCEVRKYGITIIPEATIYLMIDIQGRLKDIHFLAMMYLHINNPRSTIKDVTATYKAASNCMFAIEKSRKKIIGKVIADLM